jgi:predicted nucleic acid-binding protein
MIVVSNATPIISLSSVGRLDILEELFCEVVVSTAVYHEIKAKKGYGYDEVESEFITVESVRGRIYSDLLLNQLDLGEAETIILSKEKNADYVIIDENIGYRIAKNSGLEVIRTLSILLRAKEKGIVGELKPILDEMITKGRWYSKTVYEIILKKAGER